MCFFSFQLLFISSSSEGRVIRMEVTAQQSNNVPLQPLSYYLRHKLNPNCLIEVFQYLCLSDLVSVCDLDTDDDQFFKQLINERVIGMRWFIMDLKFLSSNMYSYPKIFRLFGKSMRKLRIRARHNYVSYILKQMIQFCAPETLQELHIVVRLEDMFNDHEPLLSSQLLKDAVPFVRGIQSIYINVDYNILCEMCSYMKKMLAYFVDNAKNLRILKVVNFRMGHFFNQINATKLTLTEIHLTDVTILKKDLRNLIQKLPNLEVFFMNASNMRAIGSVMGRLCPKLRFFGNIFIGSDNIHCYNFFKQFKNLTEISLMPQAKGVRNFKNILEILASKNTLCKLNIYVNDKSNFESNRVIDLNGFLSLKHIEFHFKYLRPNLSDGKEFFRNLMTEMKALDAVTIVSAQNVIHVFEIVQYVPYIKELNIFQMNCHRMEAQQIFQFIQETIEKRSGVGFLQPTNIIANAKQTSEMMRNNNIDRFIKVSTKYPTQNQSSKYNL